MIQNAYNVTAAYEYRSYPCPLYFILCYIYAIVISVKLIALKSKEFLQNKLDVELHLTGPTSVYIILLRGSQPEFF